MTPIEYLIDSSLSMGEEYLVADGLDEAIVGVDEVSNRVIYSVSKAVDILVERDDMTRQEATEYLYFNVIPAFVGTQTPIWMTSPWRGDYIPS